jgi:hypothetical protein
VREFILTGMVIRFGLCAFVGLVMANPALAMGGQESSTPSAAEVVPEPPEDMIDFLGRRRECSEAAPALEGGIPPAGSWLEWLRCGELAAEEQVLRQQYAGDRTAMAYLDQEPEEFQLERFIFYTDGWPLGLVDVVDQSGTDFSRSVQWRAHLSRLAHNGTATLVRVSWGRHPPRSIYLKHADFPHLDLASLSTFMDPRDINEGLLLELRFDARRGWCGGSFDNDDRPRVAIAFSSDNIRVSRQLGTNCNAGYRELEPSEFMGSPQ